MQAIILAGGFGTRLRSVVADVPKPMAPINGQPFLALLLQHLARAGFTSVVLAVGYRQEVIKDFFGSSYAGIRIQYSPEENPLGTGGAIRQALPLTKDAAVFVLNGDTFLDVDFVAMQQQHADASAELSIAVHPVDDVARYGALEVAEGRIVGFIEKGRQGRGIINGGVYLLSRDLLGAYEVGDAFSFETDFFMPNVSDLSPLAFAGDGMFIDIGVPEDYDRAQNLLSDLGGSK